VSGAALFLAGLLVVLATRYRALIRSGREAAHRDRETMADETFELAIRALLAPLNQRFRLRHAQRPLSLPSFLKRLLPGLLPDFRNCFQPRSWSRHRQNPAASATTAFTHPWS
jgi:hypothetical protein